MKKFLANIFRNPKTTIAGAVGLVLTVALQLGKIDIEAYTALIGVAASLGFVVSKDASTTGKAQ